MKESYSSLAWHQGVEKYHTFPGKGSKYFVNNRSTIPCLSGWNYLDKSNFFLKNAFIVLSNRENTRDPSDNQPQSLDHIIFSKSGWTWLFFHGPVCERDKSLHTHCIIGEQWKNYKRNHFERDKVLEIHSSDCSIEILKFHWDDIPSFLCWLEKCSLNGLWYAPLEKLPVSCSSWSLHPNLVSPLLSHNPVWSLLMKHLGIVFFGSQVTFTVCFLTLDSYGSRTFKSSMVTTSFHLGW